MKKILPILILALVSSCASQEPEPVWSHSNDVSRKYEEGKTYVRSVVNKCYSQLIGAKTRGDVSITPSDFLLYIINMPESQVDSLKAIYCTPERTLAIEGYKDAREDKLMELTSAEDVAKFYSFVNEYVSVGGRSGKMLEKASENTHPIIQLGMAIAAASVDEMLADYPITRIDYGCLEEVLKNNGYEIAMDAIEDVIFDYEAVEDPMTIEDALEELDVNIRDIVTMKNQYNDCIAGRWH
jgi:hypothetical protein